MKIVEKDKSSDFRKSQRVETTETEKLGEHKGKNSTEVEEKPTEEFVQE